MCFKHNPPNHTANATRLPAREFHGAEADAGQFLFSPHLSVFPAVMTQHSSPRLRLGHAGQATEWTQVDATPDEALQLVGHCPSRYGVAPLRARSKVKVDVTFSTLEKSNKFSRNELDRGLSSNTAIQLIKEGSHVQAVTRSTPFGDEPN